MVTGAGAAGAGSVTGSHLSGGHTIGDVPSPWKSGTSATSSASTDRPSSGTSSGPPLMFFTFDMPVWLPYLDEMTDVQAELADDLFRYILETVHDHPSGQPVRWAMNREWMDECRKLARRLGYRVFLNEFGGPEYLIGLPIEVRDDGGVPHLEPL